MGARDRWTMAIKCPACGNSGEVEVSQEDGWAFMRDQSTTIDHVPKGFSVRTAGDAPSMTFICDVDGSVAIKG